MDIEKYFAELRFSERHHLGGGDIRLTMGQQEEIVNVLKEKGMYVSESREELKIKARKLRREGKGLTYIEKEIGIPRGTVSYWCKGIKLTNEQQEVLKENSKQVREVETTRADRRKKEEAFNEKHTAKRRNTGTKGDVGVTAVAYELTKRVDAVISYHTAENMPYDMIADIDGQLFKIQVKSRVKRNGVIEVPLGSCSIHRKKTITQKYKEDDFDILAVYCFNTDCVYWLDIEDLKEYFERESDLPSIFLRIDLPLNNNISKVKMANKYTLERLIENMGI